MEAMSMGLPVLATDWSGTTAFITEETGFPIRVKEMAPVPEGAFAGHLQAEADVSHLIETMEGLIADPESGAERGRVAREHVETFYGLETMAKFVAHQFESISADLAGGAQKQEL